MANLKVIKNRIQSTENIRKITRTMEMISTVRSTQATRRLRQARPYKEGINQLLQMMAVAIKSEKIPAETLRYFAPVGLANTKQANTTRAKKVHLLILGADRGLCGGYNMHIHRKAQEIVHMYQSEGIECKVFLFGKKVTQYFRFAQLKFHTSFLSAQEQDLFALAEPLLEDFVAGKADRLEVISTVYENAARQFVQHQVLLPFSPISTAAASSSSAAAAAATSSAAAASSAAAPPLLKDMHPTQLSLMLRELAAQALRALLLNLQIEALTSEHLARRIAMKNGTEAANDMLSQFRQDFNRKRQAAITQEISEIVAGSTTS